MERPVRAREAVTEVVLSSLRSPAGIAADRNRISGAGGAAVVDDVLATVLATVGGDASGLWEHVRDGWSTPQFVTPSDVWGRLPYGRTLTRDAARIHPGVRHCLEAHPSAPFTVTDLVPDHAWQTSELGRMMRAHWGRNSQLMIPIDTGAASSTFWVWVVGRERVDFGQEDRQVAAALHPVLTAVTRHLAALRGAGRPADVAQALTPRESAVLELLLDGQPTVAIAARLGISTRTVHKHVERIFRKFGVHDRRGLIDAVRAGSTP